MSPHLQQLLGALLALFVLADVFYSVLYARIGSGILSYRLARWVWIVFRAIPESSDQRTFAGAVSLPVRPRCLRSGECESARERIA